MKYHSNTVKEPVLVRLVNFNTVEMTKIPNEPFTKGSNQCSE